MEIYHHVDFKMEHEVESQLQQLKIQYKKIPFVNRFIIQIVIAESHPAWQSLQKIMSEKGINDNHYDTIFSDEEILNAQWLRILRIPQIGYPEPKGSWVSTKPNYKNYCESCGTFSKASNFHLKKEPNLQSYDFMSLFWTSQVFAIPRVFQALEKHKLQGWVKEPTFIYKTKKPSHKIAHLVIPYITEPGLEFINDFQPTYCEICKQVKLMKYHKRGVMHIKKSAINCHLDFQLTNEWFGSGYDPRREIIVSNRFVRLAYSENWKGLQFKVVETI